MNPQDIIARMDDIQFGWPDDDAGMDGYESGEDDEDDETMNDPTAEGIIAEARESIGRWKYSRQKGLQLMRVILGMPRIAPELLNSATWPGLAAAYQAVSTGDPLGAKELHGLLRDVDLIRMSPDDRAAAMRDETRREKDFQRLVSARQRMQQEHDDLGAQINMITVQIRLGWPERDLPWDDLTSLPF